MLVSFKTAGEYDKIQPRLMKHQVERIAEDLAGRLEQWEGVDSITLAESASADVYDAYFYLSLDVYYRGEVPSPDVRQKLFSDAGAFESSSVSSKDRFLIEDLPIRVEYKDMSRIDDVLARTKENLWVFRQTGTYMFYRLKNAEVLVKGSSWIDDVRKSLKELPDEFWTLMIRSSQATMEHYLGDLSAAAVRQDNLFFLISSAGFIKSFLSLLFVINRHFEPSGRMLYEMVRELPELPENFKGRFESFLREDPEFQPARKREIAELLAKSVIHMC